MCFAAIFETFLSQQQLPPVERRRQDVIVSNIPSRYRVQIGTADHPSRIARASWGGGGGGGGVSMHEGALGLRGRLLFTAAHESRVDKRSRHALRAQR